MTERELLTEGTRKLVAAVLAIIIIAASAWWFATRGVAGELYQGFAVPVDGKTLKIYDIPGQGVHIVRLWGVEIPGLDYRGSCKVAGTSKQTIYCRGGEAARALWLVLLSDGKAEVSCEPVGASTQTGYAYVFGRCFLSDGERDIAEIMLRNGWGVSRLPTIVDERGRDVDQLAVRYLQAENLARRDRVGLWSDE